MFATTANFCDARFLCIPAVLAAVLFFILYHAVASGVCTFPLLLSHRTILPSHYPKRFVLNARTAKDDGQVVVNTDQGTSRTTMVLRLLPRFKVMGFSN
jgi:hypothetical protein